MQCNSVCAKAKKKEKGEREREKMVEESMEKNVNSAKNAQNRRWREWEATSNLAHAMERNYLLFLYIDL